MRRDLKWRYIAYAAITINSKDVIKRNIGIISIFDFIQSSLIGFYKQLFKRDLR